MQWSVFLVERLGLNWRWMYGIMLFVMIPALVLWLFMRETKHYREILAESNQRRGWRSIIGLYAFDRGDLHYIALTMKEIAIRRTHPAVR